MKTLELMTFVVLIRLPLCLLLKTKFYGVIARLAVVLLALLVLSVIEVSCMSKGSGNPEINSSYFFSGSSG